jgi:hypothetical protein
MSDTALDDLKRIRAAFAEDRRAHINEAVSLLPANRHAAFQEVTARLIRQVLGAVAESDKAMTVAKLRGARDRKRATGVKVEGRK